MQIYWSSPGHQRVRTENVYAEVRVVFGGGRGGPYSQLLQPEQQVRESVCVLMVRARVPVAADLSIN